MSRRFIGLIPGGGGGGIDLGAAGNTTGTLATISSGTAVLAGGNNITLSQNGQNITISAGGGGTLSQMWALPRVNFGAQNKDQFTGGTMQVWPVPLEMNFSCSQANALVTVSLSTSSNSSYSVNISLGLAAYTRNGSTLSLATSASQSFGFTITSNSSSVNYSNDRLLSLPFSANFTPGDYWFAASSSTATTGTNWATISNYIITINTGSSFNPFGSVANTSRQMIPGWGFYSISTAAFPSAIGFSDINGANGTGQEIPIFNLVNYTA